eukprot:1160824-Pelagomonas_calceolata.AAC.6
MPRHLVSRDRVTSLQLSADCRWLLSASMDGTLRVWDVPAAQCLQVRDICVRIRACVFVCVHVCACVEVITDHGSQVHVLQATLHQRCPPQLQGAGKQMPCIRSHTNCKVTYTHSRTLTHTYTHTCAHTCTPMRAGPAPGSTSDLPQPLPQP